MSIELLVYIMLMSQNILVSRRIQGITQSMYCFSKVYYILFSKVYIFFPRIKIGFPKYILIFPSIY